MRHRIKLLTQPHRRGPAAAGATTQGEIMATIPIRKDEPRRERLLSAAIEQRRATPDFDGSPVRDEDLRRVLEAGTKAPSGYNIQPWRFVVVRSPEGKKKLRAAAMGQTQVEEAGAVIVCCGDISAVRP